jgi:tricarballylate dehydrogenase
LPATWDIVVIGGGAAGLSAAIAARRRGATVRLVESAPRPLRGGNARHARNFRAAHGAPTWYSPGVYTTDEFMSELLRVSGDGLDQELARSLIHDTTDIAAWLMDCGVRLQDPRVGTIPYSRRTAFLLGGGKAMVNALYEAAERIGVVVSYESEAVALVSEPGGAWSVEVVFGADRQRIPSRCVVVGAGGPGADPNWLRAHFGPAADGFDIRGGPYSDGRAMQMLLIDAGAQAVGDPATCHMVAVDARGPKFDGGIVTRITGIPYGLVVDRNAAPVHVAGHDAGRSHYARWGPRIARCPGGVAFLILDSDGLGRSVPTALPPIGAETIEALAGALELDGASLERAIEAFNAERPSRRPIATPPFFAIPLRPGLTFVHYGVAVDDRMRVSTADGRTVETLFAAGMIMAANVLRRGYLAGFGITLSAVSGRRAGEAAACHVLG